MPFLPDDLARQFRAAKDIDIRSLSYGRITQTRVHEPSSWEEAGETLYDQAIFGALRAFECACGKYSGEDDAGTVCDVCRVKLAGPAGRKERFAHVELGQEIAHPLDAGGARLSVWPVIPAAYFCSQAGKPLIDLYQALVTAATAEDLLFIRSAVWKICDFLLPVVCNAVDWSLFDAATLARGLALEPRLHTPDGRNRCRCCRQVFSICVPRFCPMCGERQIDE